jgi:hypothetical protein
VPKRQHKGEVSALLVMLALLFVLLALLLGHPKPPAPMHDALPRHAVSQSPTR